MFRQNYCVFGCRVASVILFLTILTVTVFVETIHVLCKLLLVTKVTMLQHLTPEINDFYFQKCCFPLV